MVVILYVACAVALFIWYYPVYTAQTMPRPDWQQRMWFDFWN